MTAPVGISDQSPIAECLDKQQTNDCTSGGFQPITAYMEKELTNDGAAKESSDQSQRTWGRSSSLQTVSQVSMLSSRQDRLFSTSQGF